MEQLLLKGILGWKRGGISENIRPAMKDSDASINSTNVSTPRVAKTEGAENPTLHPSTGDTKNSEKSILNEKNSTR